jgi:hypothetical protein
MILLNAIPRSGSTYLFRSIAGLDDKKTTPKNNMDVIEYNGHSVFVPYVYVNNEKMYKTHLPYEWWDKYLKKSDRVIFIYGNIIDSVISTKLNRYDINHFRNCGYIGGEPKDIFFDDFLGYEHLFDSWKNKSNVLFVRYENIPKVKGKIEKFLGFSFTLNKFKLRDIEKNISCVSFDDLKNITKTYDSLIKKINND